MIKPPSGNCADLSQDADAHAVAFMDLTDDERGDLIWIVPNGGIAAYVNDGRVADGHWMSYPQPKLVAGGVGGKTGEIQCPKFSGDGHAEYLWVHEDNCVDAWLHQRLPNCRARRHQ